MAFAGFNEETLEAMNKQGGAPNAVPNQDAANAAEEKPIVAKRVEGLDPNAPGIELDLGAGKPRTDPSATKEGAVIPENPPDPSSVKPDLSKDAVVTGIVTDGGFDVKVLSDRLMKEGGITPELITELKTKIDPNVVDSYVEQFNAKLEASKPKAEPATARTEMNDFIYGAVGGQDKFGAMAGVLKKSLPQAEIDVINAKLASDNKGLVSEGLKQAVEAYNKSTGRSNTRMVGDTPNNEGDKFTFMTKIAFQKAVASEKYRTDPAYAASVDADRLKSKALDAQSTMPGQYRNVRNGQMYTL